jgi:uncharacterized protein (DUF362 family)
MDRRTFFQKSLGVSALLGAALAGKHESLFAALSSSTGEKAVDLVALKGGEPEVMFRKGIEALGGIGAFVKRGQKVAIKPNIGWDVLPERAGDTNPKLVAEIVRQCVQAGAKQVFVFDHTCDKWQRTYQNSGIERAVKDAGGTIVPGDTEGYYQDVKIPAGKNLHDAKEHEIILESDVFFNVPVLKHHSSTRMTCAMKNLMGNVWNRGAWHSNDLHQCIADFATYRKPTLNIVDAYAIVKRNGPRGVSQNDVVVLKAQLLSTDIVAADTAAAKLFGSDPKEIDYIRYAAEQKVGRMDLDHLNIAKYSL